MKEWIFFIANKWELHETVRTIERVLFNLKLNLTRLFTIMYSLFPKNSKFHKDLKKTKELFKIDLITQLKKFIRKDGKYSSGIYGKMGLLLEKSKYTYCFDGGTYFKSKIFYYDIKKFLILKKFINNKFFSIKKIFSIKKFFGWKYLRL